MKKVSLVQFLGILAVLILAAGVLHAGTSGGTAPAVGKVNVPMTVAKPSSSACTTIGASRAGYATVDVSGTTMINVSAKDTVTASSAGTDAAVKMKWNSNTAYLPLSGVTRNIPVSASASTAKFERYSGATTITVCSEKN